MVLQAGLPARLEALLLRDLDGLNIRHHGDLHLGQLLTVKDDIFIIDFAGEARRTITERRRKAPAARDVASLVRSIDYSATAALERARFETTPSGYAVPVEDLSGEVTVRHLLRFAQAGRYALPPVRYSRMYQPEQKAFEEKPRARIDVR